MYFPTAFYRPHSIPLKMKKKEEMWRDEGKGEGGKRGEVLFELDFILRHSAASELPLFHFRPMIVQRMNILSLAIHKLKTVW